MGSFEMEGEIRSSNNLLASAKVYQDMRIIAKRWMLLAKIAAIKIPMAWNFYWQSIDRFVDARAYIKGTDPMQPAEVMCIQSCVKDNDDWESDFPPTPTIGNVATTSSRHQRTKHEKVK